jgi:hypothetical protein
MPTIYLGCAAVGGLLLVIQMVLALLGGDADADADADADVHDGEGPGLGFRTVVAFITFFGIAGMAARSAGVAPVPTLIIAVATGGVAFWLVGLLMMQLNRLRSSGTVDVKNAVGVEAKVYLTVPAEKSGEGRVTVPLQGRTHQFKAITAGAAIPTGKLCKVVAVHGGDTLEVEGV